MSITYDRDSILNLYPEIKIYDFFTLDIWESYKVSSNFLNEGELFIDYNVKQYDRWDKIAEQFYGIRSWWWVIAITNNIEDPFSIYFDSGVTDSLKTLKILKIAPLIDLLETIRARRIEKDTELLLKLDRDQETT